MIAQLVRIAGLLVLLLITSVTAASAATQKEIEAALKNGTEALKAKYTGGAARINFTNGTIGDNYGVGPTCLTGLALLEAGVAANDPAIQSITKTVREAAYTQTKTYQISLCLMYLDRLGEPADVPLVQALAMRLLVAQNLNSGGWGYDCLSLVPPEEVKRLKSLKADQPAGKLHPEVEAHAKALKPMGAQTGDNSNTQFALLAVWLSRKHGVPVNNALEAIEKRFILNQDARSGNWSYSGAAPPPDSTAVGSPAMYCAGLLGMATVVARREESKSKTELKSDKPPKPKSDKPDDPFYNPPASKEPEKKTLPARPNNVQDLVIQRAFAGLGLTFADLIRGGRGVFAGPVAAGQNPPNTTIGHGDFYFLWSLERVGVVYGIEKIGNLDWFDLGSTALVRTQNRDGTWSGSNYGTEVNTAFAVLFLSRSNLARDLSSKVQKDPTSTEMRAGTGPSPTDILPNRPIVTTLPPVLDLPNPTGDEGITLASKMLKASGADWKKLLEQARDAKGATNTRALVLTAANVAETDRKTQVREALAERLCRMTPSTLRTMLKAEQAELRRAAALACAMKDDKQHIPDLIEAITDPDDSVTRAAKAGLKSLTGRDFGPAADASAGQKALAATNWKEWYEKEKK